MAQPSPLWQGGVVRSRLWTVVCMCEGRGRIHATKKATKARLMHQMEGATSDPAPASHAGTSEAAIFEGQHGEPDTFHFATLG